MRNMIFRFFMLSLLLIACNSSSQPTARKETATLTLFHSNDITGYLTPCG